MQNFYNGNFCDGFFAKICKDKKPHIIMQNAAKLIDKVRLLFVILATFFCIILHFAVDNCHFLMQT